MCLFVFCRAQAVTEMDNVTLTAAQRSLFNFISVSCEMTSGGGITIIILIEFLGGDVLLAKNGSVGHIVFEFRLDLDSFRVVVVNETNTNEYVQLLAFIILSPKCHGTKFEQTIFIVDAAFDTIYELFSFIIWSGGNLGDINSYII